jgi:predicted DNA-binding transcriptional regulator AlpA
MERPQRSLTREFLTLKGVAAYLHVSEATLRRMIRAGKFPRPIRYGGAGEPLWRREVVRAYATLAPLLPDLFALPPEQKRQRPSKPGGEK